MPSLPEIGSSLPEVVLRTAIVYLFVVTALRLSGKREVGQMSVLELVVILVISDAVPRDGDTPASDRPPSDERTT